MTDKNLEILRLQRQESINTIKNPNMTNEYLCQISCEITNKISIKINLCYIPDKLVILPESFKLYLNSLNITNISPIEAMAHIILDDLNNQLVAKWTQITIDDNKNNPDIGHKILLEDRHPRWDNKDLLNRIDRF